MALTSLFSFAIESGICLVSFYLLYWILLRKETFYQLNRIYLLSTVLISIVIPLLHLDLPIRGSEAELISSLSSISQSIFREELLQSDTTVPAQSHPFNWVVIILALYCMGTAILIIRMVYGITKILRIRQEGIAEHSDNFTIIYTKRNISPFSFLNCVFLRESLQKSPARDSILDHEYVHIRQRHTYDNIFIEIALAIFWFNPIIWFYKEAIKNTHEFLADDGAIARGNNLLAYKSFMLEQIIANPELAVSNSFASRIRKRVVMINRGTSTTASRGKVLLAVPLIFMLSLLFAGQDPGFTPVPQYPPIVYDKDSIPVFYMGQEVFPFTKELPTFKGGPYENFREYIYQELKATEVRAKQGSRGLVLVKFIVDYNGDLSFARAILADDPEIEAEAIRIVKSSPKQWEPGKMDGKSANVVFVWPLRFTQ